VTAAALRSLTMLVYGPSKAGKSTLAATSPYPRLIIDVEGGARFLPIVPKLWNPHTETPPVADGTWDTCIVHCNDYSTMEKAFQWLQLGQHQFKSVVVDSISELQVKMIDQLAGTEQMKMQTWGQLLRGLGDMLRKMRDLTMHPTNPLEAVVLTAMQREGQDGKLKPYLQGQIQVVAPYLYDVLGYIRVEEFPHADPTHGTYRVRRMYVEATDFAEAGERVQGRLGSIVEQTDLSVESMLDKIYGPRPAPVVEAAAS
jgi:hypothetical protein